ncbi:hypothetical protein F5883DRAFT_562068 [Diaporthe sp. PMI_573]|nr:hypothetical protein F5883DRAFT_562068 [Diaporthaceae sp. PMI_573]
MASPFQVEAWTEYAIGLLILGIRIFCRCSHVGRNWEGDDYFAVMAIFFWTGAQVTLQLIGDYGSIIGINDEIALSLSDEQIRGIVIGSKCLIAGWVCYVSLIWSLKACMLFFFIRLTLHLWQRKLVVTTAFACGAGYIAMISVIMTHCMPFDKNWQVYPYPGDSCALKVRITLALAVTNITTDLMILSIPVPLLWTARMPFLRKIVCTLWLCTGVFVIIATLIRCIMCLQTIESINSGTIWSIRETFVGIIAVNVPAVAPWIVKCASVVSSLASKYSPKESRGNSSSPTIVTIGRQRIRPRRKGPGWTTFDTESERVIDGVELGSYDKNNNVAVSAGGTKG